MIPSFYQTCTIQAFQMLKRLLKFLKSNYHKVVQSIAFYPVLINVLFLVGAIVAIQVEGFDIITKLKKEAPFLFIQDYDTARSILSTFIGGMISLTVFSFTMVMVVLSQASSDFSPRLLPGLVSNKKHQIILGFYIGTLLYCTIILIALGANGLDSNKLGLSTMLAAIFSVGCIGLFVYFIHSISRAIQIHNIIEGIFEESNKFLKDELKKQNSGEVALQYVDTEDWETLRVNKTGYFRGFDIDLMENSIKDLENQIEVLPYLNEHIWKGAPVLRIQGEVTDAQRENLIFCLNISSNRHEVNKGIGGLIKLMEIAVKAMSPGINDPGTAIDAVTKSGQLLGQFLQLPKITSQVLEKEKLILIQNNISAEELMRIVIQPIRLYSKKDSAVMYELIAALRFIERGNNLSDVNKKVVAAELDAMYADIDTYIENTADRARLVKLF